MRKFQIPLWKCVSCLYVFVILSCAPASNDREVDGDVGDDDADDDTGDDDASDDDASDDDAGNDDSDDLPPEIPGGTGLGESTDWCPNGYATQRGGCIERLAGGAPGRTAVEAAAWEDFTYVVASRGREVVLYVIDAQSIVRRELVLTRMGYDPDLAVDADGGVHVVFQQLEQETIEYMTWEPGTWRRETIASVPGLTSSWKLRRSSAPSIAAGNGLVHVTFWDGADLIHARRDGSWTTEVVPVSEAWFPNSIALGPSGEVHVASTNAAMDEIFVSTLRDDEWSVETAANSAGPMNLYVGASGDAYLCWVDMYEYEGETCRNLYFATNEGGDWFSGQVDDNTHADGCDLWAGGDEFVRVLGSSDVPDGTFIYDSRTGFDYPWFASRIETVPANGQEAAYVQREPADSAAVFHRSNELTLAVGSEDVWLTTPIDGRAGVNVSADRNPDGTVYAAALSAPDRLEVFSFPEGGELVGEDLSTLIPGDYDFTDYVSISARNDCVAIYVGDSSYLARSTFRYLILRDGEWSAHTYDWGKGLIGSSYMMVGDDCSIHFVANNNQHWVFHASDETGNWVVTRLDWLNRGQWVTGALDGDGNPVVMYHFDSTYLARRINGQWTSELFDESPLPYATLYFDDGNDLWIVGNLEYNGEVHVFRQTSVGWAEDVLPSSGFVVYEVQRRGDGPLHVMVAPAHQPGAVVDWSFADDIWQGPEELDLIAGTSSIDFVLDAEGGRHAFYLGDQDIVYHDVDALADRMQPDR